MSLTQHYAQCMVDTSSEFFEIRVRQCESIEVLRRAAALEVEAECRQERIGTINQRLKQLR